MTELFQARHIGTDDDAQRTMLSAVGDAHSRAYASVEEVVAAAVPAGIRVDPAYRPALPAP
ncbi:hypothetical protein N136_04049, partial [Leifsonia aquatica ATCC 14665]